MPDLSEIVSFLLTPTGAGYMIFLAFLVWVLLVVWAVLTFCIPFFVFGMWRRSKKYSKQLDQTNSLLELILEHN